MANLRQSEGVQVHKIGHDKGEITIDTEDIFKNHKTSLQTSLQINLKIKLSGKFHRKIKLP